MVGASLYELVLKIQLWEISQFVDLVLFRITTNNVERLLLSLVDSESLKDFLALTFIGIACFSFCDHFTPNLRVRICSLITMTYRWQLIIFYLFFWVFICFFHIFLKSAFLGSAIILHLWKVALYLPLIARLRRRCLFFADWIVERSLLKEVVIAIGLAVV